MIRTPDVGIGRLHVESAQRVDEATYRAWTRRAVPRAGDLILAREAPVGNVGIVQPGVHPVLGQRTVLIRPRPEVLDPHYLNYLMSGPAVRAWMDGVSIGATVPHLNMADIRALKLPPLPTIDAQRRIGAILSAYDDLIGNDNRRLAVLEEITRRIYREWFVDFRYPGHEGVALVDSELGLIPEGWEVHSVREVARLVRGQSYRGTDVAESGGAPFVTLKCIDRGGGFRRDGIKAFVGQVHPDRTVRAGDIVVAVTDMTQERRIVEIGRASCRERV